MLRYYFNASSAAVESLDNHTSSDIVQYAFDADNGRLWFGRNGTWYSSSWATTGDPANGVNPTVSGIDTTKTYVKRGFLSITVLLNLTLDKNPSSITTPGISAH